MLILAIFAPRKSSLCILSTILSILSILSILPTSLGFAIRAAGGSSPHLTNQTLARCSWHRVPNRVLDVRSTSNSRATRRRVAAEAPNVVLVVLCKSMRA